jgi:hypothetical protein
MARAPPRLISGIVVDQRSLLSGRYMIVHNVRQGPKMEDVMFASKITGHCVSLRARTLERVFWRIIRKSKSQHSIQTAIGSQYDLFTSVKRAVLHNYGAPVGANFRRRTSPKPAMKMPAKATYLGSGTSEIGGSNVMVT